MTKSSSILVSAVVLLTGLAAWQAMQIRDLRNVNGALSFQARSLTAVLPKRAADDPPGGRKAGKSGEEYTSKATETPADPAAAEEEKQRAEREARFQEMRTLERTQRIDARILALRTKLNLTPEQESAIRLAMEKGSSDRDALRESMRGFRRNGGDSEENEKARQEQMAKFAAAEQAQEDAITSTMTDEQIAAYEDYKTEQKQTEVESRANRQLNELQGKLSLTEEQKDAAFQFYAQQEQNGFDPAKIAAEGGDVRKAFEERQQAALEGMESILTPEQYELYSKQEQERSALFRDGGGFGPRGGGPPPGFGRP